MPRPCRVFTQQEIIQVRKMQSAGMPRDEIAKTLGITTPSLVWHMRCGRFGNLPKNPGRQAGRPGKLQRPDIESDGTLFGCQQKDWKQRQQQIKNNWPDDERYRRSQQQLPNVPDIYAKFHRGNPNYGQNKPRQQNTFHDRRNRPH